jgi:hypothetical protein
MLLLLPPAENCVVVAQGEMGHDGVFRVQELGFPGCEKRSDLPATAKVGCCCSSTANRQC